MNPYDLTCHNQKPVFWWAGQLTFFELKRNTLVVEIPQINVPKSVDGLNVYLENSKRMID